MEENQKKCPFCAELINRDAIKCKHCGEFLDSSLRQARKTESQVFINATQERKWSPGVAALLSFIIPGAGQMYKGNIFTGLVWLIFVIIGYMALVLPGIILHLICIISATSGDPNRDGG
ncbi:hypothetical protein [Mongoliitalea lutea]|uniref:TM2 domain-containing protein n=1 Tax=Mongoliitalea lutea TaxID=849756 RepID=A0A8J3D0H2_9BACT|nr:hypothetical protein [Mongoliitalea lutea]GHB52831.1 hypothetical protein GCM10008106_36770 [Mongoliitalea lutea]